MATTKYNLNMTATSTYIEEFKTAMTAQFGVAFVVLYQAAASLIFTCSALSDKTFKVFKDSNNYAHGLMIGDGWVSGDTVTNQVVYTNSNSGTISQTVLLTAPNFFCLCAIGDTTSKISLVAKDTAGNALSINTNSYQSDSVTSMSKYLNSDKRITFVETNTGFFGSDGSIYQINSFLKDSISKKLIFDELGEKVYIDGIQMGCYSHPYNAALYLGNTFIAPGMQYSFSSYEFGFKNSLMIPYVEV